MSAEDKNLTSKFLGVLVSLQVASTKLMRVATKERFCVSSLGELNYALGFFGAEHFCTNSQDWGSECSLQWLNTLPNLEFISVCEGIILILVNVSVTPCRGGT